jgi:hypothetical protein
MAAADEENGAALAAAGEDDERRDVEDIHTQSSSLLSSPSTNGRVNGARQLAPRRRDYDALQSSIEHVKLFDLVALPQNSTWQFVILATVFVVAFLVHDFAQEYVFKNGFSYGLLITLADFVGCSVFPVATQTARGASLQPNGALTKYAALSVLVLTSSALSTHALQYVSYPLKVVLRSGRLIPTMFVARLCFGKRYSALTYAAAMLSMSLHVATHHCLLFCLLLMTRGTNDFTSRT